MTENIYRLVIIQVFFFFGFNKIGRRARNEKLWKETLHLRSDNAQATIPQESGKGNVAKIASLKAAAGLAGTAGAGFTGKGGFRRGGMRAERARKKVASCELQAASGELRIMTTTARSDRWISGSVTKK